MRADGKLGPEESLFLIADAIHCVVELEHIDDNPVLAQLSNRIALIERAAGWRILAGWWGRAAAPRLPRLALSLPVYQRKQRPYVTLRGGVTSAHGPR